MLLAVEPLLVQKVWTKAVIKEAIIATSLRVGCWVLSGLLSIRACCIISYGFERRFEDAFSRELYQVKTFIYNLVLVRYRTYPLI